MGRRRVRGVQDGMLDETQQHELIRNPRLSPKKGMWVRRGYRKSVGPNVVFGNRMNEQKGGGGEGRYLSCV